MKAARLGSYLKSCRYSATQVMAFSGDVADHFKGNEFETEIVGGVVLNSAIQS
jgi:hypothetical protein